MLRLAVLVLAAAVVLCGLVWAFRAARTPSFPTATGAAAAARASAVPKGSAQVYVAPSGVLFDLASADLAGSAIPTLQGIAADLKRSGASGTIQVRGYTDDSGPSALNQELSAARATRVARWLVTDGGIDEKRIEVLAFGEDAPQVPNDTEEHRRQNRCVIIAVVR